MISARRLVAGVTLTLGLLASLNAMESAPSVAGQPMATATPPCPTMDPQYVYVEPVISPTDLLTQTITARLDYAVWIKVLAESGTFTMTRSTSGHSVVMRLLPDVAHHLEVAGRWQFRADCPWFTTQTSRDRNGDALIIVQGDPPTPTATPAPEMLRNVNVFGIVVARETPVRARILLHPSDGRCPWSDGYRSGEDGRLDRTCSDARQGSTISVWVLGDHHDPWSQSYEVERGDHGAKPIEVRAILTARPASASPTPTLVDEIGETRWFGNVIVEGGVPVPWASVDVDAHGYGVRCLSPVNTDDAGHFEVWCFGGHSMYTDFRIAVRASGCEPWEAPMGRVSTGGVPLRDIELVCATSTPAGAGTPPTPTATATPGDGQGEPSPSYLPMVLRNTDREAIPTAVAPLRATPNPDTDFLLETWTHTERGPGCRMFYSDFPTYSFNDSTGVLHVQGDNRRLEPGAVRHRPLSA
jgi:hypothetical protein